MFKLIFLQNYRLDLLRACRKRNVFFRVVLGSEVVVSVPALKSCWTRNASIFVLWAQLDYGTRVSPKQLA